LSESSARYDSKGVPICPGDLLKTFHFQSDRWRKRYYLYHVAVLEDGYLMMVPVCYLEPSKKALGGGKCALTPERAAEAEVISGHGPGDCLSYEDRSKRTPWRQAHSPDDEDEGDS